VPVRDAEGEILPRRPRDRRGKILAFSERGERKAEDPASGEAASLLPVVARTCNHLYRTKLFISDPGTASTF
jgi:hypothetical protein